MLEDSGTQDSCPHTSSLLLPGLLWTRGIVTPGGWPNGRTFPSHMSFSSVFWRVLETGRLSPPKTAYPGVHNVVPPLAFSGPIWSFMFPVCKWHEQQSPVSWLKPQRCINLTLNFIWGIKLLIEKEVLLKILNYKTVGAGLLTRIMTIR